MHIEIFLVFVYGTMKINQSNHFFLLNPNGTSHFIGNDSTKDKYPLLIGTRYNVPFLVDLPHIGYNLQGEIYEVDEKMLAKFHIFIQSKKFLLTAMMGKRNISLFFFLSAVLHEYFDLGKNMSAGHIC